MPSNNQVKKAGEQIRLYLVDPVNADPVAARDALDVLLEFRAAHQYPLVKATMGLRSMVKTERCEVRVTQRLKRVPTIADKLVREPKMSLARMQDLGGCRAVLDNIDEVRRVQRRLARNRPPLRVSDYIESPKASGYRGVHVVVAYDQRAIEVQLRTLMMHEWAIAVERLSGRLRADLKSSKGPAEVLAVFSLISEAMALEEGGQQVPDGLLEALAAAKREAVPFMTTGGTRS